LVVTITDSVGLLIENSGRFSLIVLIESIHDCRELLPLRPRVVMLQNRIPGLSLDPAMRKRAETLVYTAEISPHATLEDVATVGLD